MQEQRFHKRPTGPKKDLRTMPPWFLLLSMQCQKENNELKEQLRPMFGCIMEPK